MNGFIRAYKNIVEEIHDSSYEDAVNTVYSRLANKELVLYGAGELGASIAKWLLRNDISITCFCDRSLNGRQPDTGVPIISPINLIKAYPTARVIICSIAHRKSIHSDLLELGFHEEQIIFCEELGLREMSLDDFSFYKDGYQWAYDFFKDDISKQIILNRMHGYLLSSTQEYSSNVIYFDSDIYELNKSEVVIDGGMYIGDTTSEFIKKSSNRFTSYHGFEIDEKNFQKANDTFRQDHRVHVVNMGLWKENTSLLFSSNLDASSKLSTKGNLKVNVIKLDDYCSRNNIEPSIIKLDIEGAEHEALLGSKDVILKYKPKLTICAYHKPEDVYSIPRLIQEYRDDYKLQLRHYSPSLFDTVLYAT